MLRELVDTNANEVGLGPTWWNEMHFKSNFSPSPLTIPGADRAAVPRQQSLGSSPEELDLQGKRVSLTAVARLSLNEEIKLGDGKSKLLTLIRSY